MATKERMAISIKDTGDNHPIHYELRSDGDGFHLIDFEDLTFEEKITFSYRILDDVISALIRLKEFK